MSAKSEALDLYARAKLLDEGWEAAAHALAACLSPAAPRKPAKNKRQGGRSLSGLVRKLPKFTRQACGHTFNSSGCAICPYCPRTPAKFIEGSGPSAIQQRQTAVQTGVLAEWAARNPGKKNEYHGL